jgi:hypothetical protein
LKTFIILFIGRLICRSINGRDSLFLSKRGIRVGLFRQRSSIYSGISLFWGVWCQQCISTSFGSARRGALGLSGSLLPYLESGPSFTRASASPFSFLSKRGIPIRLFRQSSSVYSGISLFMDVWWQQCLSTSFGSARRGALGLSGCRIVIDAFIDITIDNGIFFVLFEFRHTGHYIPGSQYCNPSGLIAYRS